MFKEDVVQRFIAEKWKIYSDVKKVKISNSIDPHGTLLKTNFLIKMF